MFEVIPSNSSCGATIQGLDLRLPLSAALLSQFRKIWLTHQVIAVIGQDLAIADLERITLQLGPRSEDPFIAPIPGHHHVVEVRREAHEKTKLFAENWHSDWSFLPRPPAATALYACVIPPIGGATQFANQYAAWERIPRALRDAVGSRNAIHSARRGYAPDGAYGENDRAMGRSMAISFSSSARKTQTHPIKRVHPETGKAALFVSPAYTIGIENMPDDEAHDLLEQLFEHMASEEVIYRHRWEEGTLLIWDNRCLVHRATGGYDGYRRLLQRVTIADTTTAHA